MVRLCASAAQVCVDAPARASAVVILPSMKRETLILGVAGALLCLPACRGDGSTGSADPGAATETSGTSSSGGALDLMDALQGSWTSEACESDGANAFRRTFTFDGDDWDIAFVIYGDPECSPGQEFIRFDFGGTVSVDEPSSEADGASNAFFGFSRRTITPVSDAAQAFLTEGAACEGATWSTGAPVDVHAQGCPTFGVLAADTCAGEFDLVAVDSETLQLGTRPADNNMCEEPLRPTALGPVLVRVSE